MANNKKTAFLVIHGVGAHTTFQACDSFVQGFCDALTDESKANNGEQMFELEHMLKQRENWLGTGMPWVQNYIAYTLPKSGKTIDFYEYFWDIYMVHEANFTEAFQMLSTASKGAHEFYKRTGDPKKRQSLLEDGTDLSEFGRKTKFGSGHPEFKPAGYLKLLGPFFTIIAKISPFVPFLMKIIDKWSKTQIPILKDGFAALQGLMVEPVPDFLGDLVRYLDLDPRSERFEIRRKIINGALEELRALLKDDSYDQVIIAGHSLGSVIGYDALNRVIQEISVDSNKGGKGVTNSGKKNNGYVIQKDEAKKIEGLITFGSPLDKIALFFWQHVREGKKVQQQVLAHLRGFRATPMDKYDTDAKLGKNTPDIKLKFKIGNPIVTELDDSIRWLNFYQRQDIISGKLDLYKLDDQTFKNLNLENGDGNIRIFGKFSKLNAHGCYWGGHKGKKMGTNMMHKTIIDEFFPDDTVTSP
ncbi:hypothetical protein ACFLYN_04270 [Chloroflexota bacterium]